MGRGETHTGEYDTERVFNTPKKSKTFMTYILLLPLAIVLFSSSNWSWEISANGHHDTNHFLKKNSSMTPDSWSTISQRLLFKGQLIRKKREQQCNETGRTESSLCHWPTVFKTLSWNSWFTLFIYLISDTSHNGSSAALLNVNPAYSISCFEPKPSGTAGQGTNRTLHLTKLKQSCKHRILWANLNITKVNLTMLQSASSMPLTLRHQLLSRRKIWITLGILELG